MDTRGCFPGVKRPGRETDHSPPSCIEVKECVELYLQFPNTPSWRGAQLKRRDNFTFTFMINTVVWTENTYYITSTKLLQTDKESYNNLSICFVEGSLLVGFLSRGVPWMRELSLPAAQCYHHWKPFTSLHACLRIDGWMDGILFAVHINTFLSPVYGCYLPLPHPTPSVTVIKAFEYCMTRKGCFSEFFRLWMVTVV
jgi:hypothetical protein